MSDAFDLLKTLEEGGTTFFLEKGLKGLFNYIKANSSSQESFHEKTLEQNVLPHYRFLIKWSQQLEFIGLGGNLFHTDSSIALEFSRSNRSGQKEAFELKGHTIDDILQLPEHVLIEGEPGAGKTTTLKKLLRDYFFSAEGNACDFSLPIVIRLREVKSNTNLYLIIARILGVEVQSIFEKRTFREKVYQNEKEFIQADQIRVLSEEQLLKLYEDEITKELYLLHQSYTFRDVVKEVEVHRVNDVNVEDYISNLLNSRNILLLLDGLDELNSEISDEIYDCIAQLSLRLIQSKMIVTSRFGVGNYAFDNFSVFFIRDLKDEQIQSIAKNLLQDDAEHFILLLKEKSYYELANRALFLTLLIYIYKKNKNKDYQLPLPESSTEVYDEVLDLFIKSWDEDRNIHRTSKYGLTFDKVKKKRFLSHVSYYLTYRLKQKEFKINDLEQVYYKIYHKFNLPRNEAKEVAREISQHTGLIIQTGFASFEFSHLVIQEYLCACYILTMPSEKQLIKNYVDFYPAPLAMVVVLSDTPTAWLNYLISTIAELIIDESKRTLIYTEILRRLLREGPYFESSPKLAIAFSIMFDTANCANAAFREIITRAFILFPSIKFAFEYLLGFYGKKSHIFIKRKFNFSRNPNIAFHEDYTLPTFISLIDTDEFREIIMGASN